MKLYPMTTYFMTAGAFCFNCLGQYDNDQDKVSINTIFFICIILSFLVQQKQHLFSFTFKPCNMNCLTRPVIRCILFLGVSSCIIARSSQDFKVLSYYYKSYTMI